MLYIESDLVTTTMNLALTASTENTTSDGSDVDLGPDILPTSEDPDPNSNRK